MSAAEIRAAWMSLLRHQTPETPIAEASVRVDRKRELRLDLVRDLVSIGAIDDAVDLITHHGHENDFLIDYWTALVQELAKKGKSGQARQIILSSSGNPHERLAMAKALSREAPTAENIEFHRDRIPDARIWIESCPDRSVVLALNPIFYYTDLYVVTKEHRDLLSAYGCAASLVDKPLLLSEAFRQIASVTGRAKDYIAAFLAAERIPDQEKQAEEVSRIVGTILTAQLQSMRGYVRLSEKVLRKILEKIPSAEWRELLLAKLREARLAGKL